MKRTISLYFIILFFIGFCAINAQAKTVKKDKKAPISLDSLIFKKLTNRLEIGFNNPKQYGARISSTFFNGYKVGLTTELAFKNNFSLLTGVMYNFVYSDKMQKYDLGKFANYSTYGHFLNVPILAVYSLPLSKNFKFFGYAGPNLNYGLSQNQTIASTEGTIPTKYTDLYAKSILNQFDLQITLGGGVQWGKYQVKGGYDFGLFNINKLTTGNIYQRGWYVSLSVNL